MKSGGSFEPPEQRVELPLLASASHETHMLEHPQAIKNNFIYFTFSLYNTPNINTLMNLYF